MPRYGCCIFLCQFGLARVMDPGVSIGPRCEKRNASRRSPYSRLYDGQRFSRVCRCCSCDAALEEEHTGAIKAGATIGTQRHGPSSVQSQAGADGGTRARAHGPRNRYAFMLAHALRADRRHTRHACGHTLSLSSPKLGSYWRHRVASRELGLRRCGTGSITAALGLSATCSSARRYGSSFLTVAL